MYKVSSSCQISDINSIYTKYFGYPSNGFFIEIGAFDGESFSNTSCLADHGWRGIYVEPIKSQYLLCMDRHKNNDVIVFQSSIGQIEGEIDIFFGGSLTTTNLEQVGRYSEIEWSKHKSFAIEKCNQIKMETLLNKFNVDKGFDILCVDVEGQEKDVFDSFNLSYWKPKMMIVELEDNHESFQIYENHVKTPNLLRKEIINNGYTEIYKDHVNTIFIRNDINSKHDNI